MAYILAMMVGLGSFGLYMSAFFFPEVHRKYDLVWSGVGLFYALVLWVCAGRITGGVLLGQMSSVALLGWFSWQNLQLRRDRTPLDQQTQLPDSIKTPNDALTLGSQTLKSLFNRNAQSTPTVTPATATATATATEPATKSSRPARAAAPAAAPSRSPRPETASQKPAPASESTPASTSESGSASRSGRRPLKKPAQTASASTPEPTVNTEAISTNRREIQPIAADLTPRPTPTAGIPIPSAEPQEQDEGGEWETAELPLEDALGRFSPEVLNSLLEDTPNEPPASETDPIYLRAELMSEPQEPASRSGRRRGRRSRSTSARQLDIPSPYSSGDDLEEEAIAFGEASPASTSRPRTELRTTRRRRSPSTASDRDLFSFSSATYEEASPDDKAVPSPRPTAERSDTQSAKSNPIEEAIAEDLTAPGNLDTTTETNPSSETSTSSSDADSDDWF